MVTTEPSLAKDEVDIILLRALLQAAQLKGVSGKKMLDCLGLSSTCLDLPGSRISLEHLEHAVKYAYQFVKREELSPLLAKVLAIEGLIFQIHVSGICSTLGEYSRLAPGIKRVYGEIGELNIAKAGEQLTYSWVPVDRASAAAALFGDAFLCSSIFFAQLFGSEPLLGARIDLQHSKPVDERFIRSMCGDSIAYAQSDSRLHLSEVSLNSPRVSPSATLEGNLPHILDQLIDRSNVPDAFLRSVQMAVTQSLPTGRCSITTVAASLRMSERTLQRALDKRNTTFQIELQATRSKLAKKYLRENQMTITQLAFLVGYVDQSSFSTAFKAWCGVAPSEYRKMHTGPSK